MVPTRIDAGQSSPGDDRPVRGRKVQIVRAHTTDEEVREKTKIVMVDPHAYSAEGLRALLGMRTDDLEIISIVAGVEKAGEQLRRNSANLLIIEPGLPGAMAAIKAARQLPGEINVVALSSQEDRRQAVEVIQAGAQAYISKQIDPDELISVLRLVRTGKVVLSAFAMAALVTRSHEDAGVLNGDDRKLLGLITEGLDNSEIARRLSVSESTLKRQISRLLKKMNARNKVQAATYAAVNGLLEE